MRVLVVAAPLVGHVLPLLPLARALRDAGHDVLLATGPGGVSAARSGGLAVEDVAPGLSIGPSFGAVSLRHPVQAVRGAGGHDRGTGFVGLLFGAVAARMADGLFALAERWEPDLVVQEPLAGAGGLVAAVRRVPVVVVNTNLFDGAALFASTIRALAREGRRRGLAAVPPPADVLNLAPSSVASFPSGRPLRFVPVAGEDFPPPEYLTRPGDRPRIIVSRSTVADPRPDRLMTRVVAASVDADVEVVLARADERVLRRPLPANVRAEGWLPFPAVFPAAAGTVHHGGAGTLLTALAAGIPQLLVPGAGDRRVNGELVARRGAGISVPAQQISARDLERLATDDRLAASAREVAQEMAALPAPAEVVDSLVALVR